MTDFEHGRPVTHRRQPETPFIGIDGAPWEGRTAGQFWSWAFSDVLMNNTRGILAEFIVGAALDALPEFASAWESYDLKTRDGIRIEVKASGHRQSWHQEHPSRPRFSVRPATSWEAATNAWGSERARNSDAYVFALHEETSLQRTDPLDLRQWRFWVLATRDIDLHLGSQQTLGLSRLSSLARESGDALVLPRLVREALKRRPD